MASRVQRSRGLDFVSRVICFLSLAMVVSLVATQTTNPTDLQVLHEIMYSMNFEYEWDTYFPDPCVSGPQGIICTPDPATGVLYVTQMQFGYISPVANIIPCSFNATMPSSIANLTRLDTLAFYSCFMHSPVTIPTTITSLTSLRVLSLSGNSAITGAIPTGLGNLASLQRLVLSQNSLQGPLPEDLGNLAMLIQLDLSHNNFTGAIPASFSNLNSLLNMDLRYNHLEGSFPESFCAGLPELQRLAVSYNKLTGTLPDRFTGLKSLAFLDLSHNGITGELPSSLGGLTSLEDLFLNSNGLQGAIPASLGELSRLVRLDLSSCDIGSSIPASLEKLENLRFLSVSNNKLLGSIPGGLAGLPRLFTLNLDGNRLSGPVPFPANFVKRMGRNMRLEDNPGLCYTPQLVFIKVPLGLSQCPEPVTVPAVAPVASPLLVSTPNGAARGVVSILAHQWGVMALALGFFWY